MRTICFVASLLLLVSPAAQGRTWRVNPAGTDDAPTLHAAMDSAAAYDVVVAEAGQYYLGDCLDIPQFVKLIGEDGPAETLLYGVDAMTSYCTVNIRTDATLSGVHVRSQAHS